MKQIISALFLCMLLSGVPRLQAQNIQLHYDFGRSLYDKDLQGRPLFTSTVEKFHPDTWGSTYFFVCFASGVERPAQPRLFLSLPPKSLRTAPKPPPAPRSRLSPTAFFLRPLCIPRSKKNNIPANDIGQLADFLPA